MLRYISVAPRRSGSCLNRFQANQVHQANFYSTRRIIFANKMALIPYLMDYEIRPRRFRDQFLGLDLSTDDFLTDVFDRPSSRSYLRPWRNLASLTRDIGSTIKSDKDKFQVNLDVQHFSPEEISVKISDKYVVVEGKHEEKKDEHGFISRQFKRRYTLPESCNPELVQSKLSSDGVLSIVAPKTTSENEKERVVPISQTGPVRRKLQDSDEKEEPNGEVEEAKAPQKKRKR